MDTRGVRNLAKLVRHTVFHPQWLLYRHERKVGAFLKPGMRGIVLDIGCAGKTVRDTVLRSGATYIGLDYPRTATEMYGTRPDIFGDAHCLPMYSGSVDSVLLLNVLEHLIDANTALSEASRVLKSGGTCLIEVPFLYPLHDQPFDYRRWTRHGLVAIATRAGLDVVSIVPIGKPMETAGLLINLSLSRSLMRLLATHNPFAILGLMLPIVFLIVNVTARLFGIFSKDDWMPIVYRAVLTKPSVTVKKQIAHE